MKPDGYFSAAALHHHAEIQGYWISQLSSETINLDGDVQFSSF
jgi:hypothetical protein